VRTELHRVSGRGRELLLAQHADEIGAALRIGDRFDLARVLSDAARTVSYYVDAGIRTAGNALPRRGFAALRRPVRRPLDEGVLEFNGEVILARDARPERDPGLILRVAAASATTGLPLSASTLSRLSENAPELRTPWPRQALKDLLVMLAAGPTTVATIEALDRTGLWGRLFPEWGAVRDLPPRDVVHIWTVDRHLVEAVSRASAFTTRVSRPDLLVLGALCHDIGKGRGGDHSVIGAELATQIGTRLGLWPSDIEILSKMVRYHLLLPDTATRRDLQNPKTIDAVVDALGGDPVLLELLHTLAEADSLATGPGVWGDWKASLIGDLVRRCRLVMAGEPLPQPDPIDPRYLALAANVRVHVELTPGDSPHIFNVTMIAPDRRGLLSKAAGVLALNSLRVHSASVNSHEGSAINTFVVSPHFGSPPAAELLRQQFILALDGELDVLASLERRERDAAVHGGRAGEVAAAVPISAVPAPPRVLWLDDTAPGELVVQIRATDRAGLLARLTSVFERDGMDIAWAKVTTLGSSVVDAFCITVPALAETDSARSDHTAVRDELERDLYAVLPAPPPVKPAEQAS
jgi:[protein-PII] uridylyltransferase